MAVPGPPSPPPRQDWFAYWKECRETIGKFEHLMGSQIASGFSVIVTVGIVAIALVVTHFQLNTTESLSLSIAVAIAVPGGVIIIWREVNTNGRLMRGAIRSAIEAEHYMLPCGCAGGKVGLATHCPTLIPPPASGPVMQNPCWVHLTCSIEAHRSMDAQARDRTMGFSIAFGLAIVFAIAIVIIALKQI